ncbi:MAG: MATE family efflux transporter [Rhodobacteraceae bacterium]|nr:MAG: MATE family efflux transporter [Paracoccaceae bacterium]
MQITHSRVLKIAVPILLANITVPLLGLVDTGVVGQIKSPVPIGAVAIGALILTTVYWFFGFLRMGTTGLTSQAVGAGDRAEVAAILSRVLLFAIVSGGLIFVLQTPLFWGAFQVSPASEAVESMARDYLRIRIYSAPAAIAVLGLVGWLIGQERTREVLYLQLWMNGLNIILDLWFVLGLGWGASGVALATVLAEMSGLGLGLWFCRDTLMAPTFRAWDAVLNRVRLVRMLTVNRDILLRTLMLQVIFVSFTFVAARYGDVPLASTQVLMQFFALTSFALDGFAFAVETLVGQAVGGKNRQALRQSVIKCTQWGVAMVFILAAGIGLGGEGLITVMTKATEVQVEAQRYLPYLIAAAALSLPAFMLDGVFLGATQTAAMRDMMAVSLGIYILCLLALLPFLAMHGLWIALLVSLVARGATLAMRYPALESAADRG